MTDHLYAWKEAASLTWYGPYADRELAELGRERIQQAARWRGLKLVGYRETDDGIELFELPKGRRSR